MRAFLFKSASLFVLLLSLSFFSGIAPAYVALSGTTAVDRCCADETDTPSPFSEGECTDPECRCLSCSSAILTLSNPFPTSFWDEPTSLFATPTGLPSDYIPSIDYPPETL